MSVSSANHAPGDVIRRGSHSLRANDESEGVFAELQETLVEGIDDGHAVCSMLERYVTQWHRTVDPRDPRGRIKAPGVPSPQDKRRHFAL